MTTKRKPTLKQVFNAWLKCKKKNDEACKAKQFIYELVNEFKEENSGLIEHEGSIYRIAVIKNQWDNQYEIKKIAEAFEMPIKN